MRNRKPGPQQMRRRHRADFHPYLTYYYLRNNRHKRKYRWPWTSHAARIGWINAAAGSLRVRCEPEEMS